MSKSSSASDIDIDGKIRRLVLQQAPSAWEESELTNELPIFKGGIGLDSVAGVELILACEKAFEVKIPVSVIDEKLAIGALIRIVKDLLADDA
jgi:acyl carrier protein